jgi:RDD family
MVLLLDPSEGSGDASLAVLVLCWAVLVYGYFVVLKHSRFSPVGYRLARARIVDSYGRPPGLGALTLRLSFGLLGPFNVFLDMLWIPSDRHKQALRDKFAHTYVVKASAEPAGPARVVFRTYYIMGMSFVFQEVEPVSMGSGQR